MRRVGLLLLVAAAACSERDAPQVKRQADPPRRVIEPPARGVRALPPHAIRADGVGPYKLGASAEDLLEQLPSGPRIRQFTIPGIVHRDMLRGEDDAILIGTEPQGKALFVAVVRGDIARTESGIQVGSTRDELERALGAPIEELDRARDPRIVIPAKLDNARILIDGNRISAIVLTPAVERSKDGAGEKDSKDPRDPKDAKDSKDPKEHPCTRPTSDRENSTFGACLTAAGELLRFGNEELALLARDGEKVITRVPVPGLVFAAALRNPGDGRDDVVAVTKQAATTDSATWSLIVYRLLDGKLVRLEPAPVYQLTAAHARWIGAELRELDIALELTAKVDSIDVAGLLTTRLGGAIRDVVVIPSVPVPRRRVKAPPPEATHAPTPDVHVPRGRAPE